MKKRSRIHGVLCIAVVGLVSAMIPGIAFSAGETSVAALAQDTHFHGIAVDNGNPGRVLLATHHGLYAVAADGTARRISETRDDFMGFTPHPTDPRALYASGHPAGGGNLGFITSTDGGRSWAKLSDGIGGPVDFHQMDVSMADTNVIYGVHGGLQRSTDGGQSWAMMGPAPEGLIDLAASSTSADTLYAATKGGLLKSLDAGRSWQPAHVVKRPATMVHVARQGEVYTFIIGTGLVRAVDGEANWQLVGNDFGDAFVLHLAVEPSNENQLYAISLEPQTKDQRILASGDGGKTWRVLGQPTE